MIQKITFKDKENLLDDPTIPDNKKISAQDVNTIKQVVNQNVDNLNLIKSDVDEKTSFLLDNQIQDNLYMITQRDEMDKKVDVLLKDAEGRAVMLETSADQVYLNNGIPMSTYVEKISNTNLLDNADFQIWQKGESFTSLQTREYTADRWRVRGDLKNWGIKRDAYGYAVNKIGTTIADQIDVEQVLRRLTFQEISQINETNKMTLSIGGLFNATPKKVLLKIVGIDLQTVEYTEYIDVNNSHSNYNLTFDIKNLKYGDELFLFIRMHDSEVLSYVKLEQGGVPTFFKSKNYIDELLVCMQYYQVFYRAPIYTTSATGITYVCPRSFFVPMIDTPAISITELLNSSAQPQSRTLTGTAPTRNGLVNFSLNATVGQYGYISFIFDANLKF